MFKNVIRFALIGLAPVVYLVYATGQIVRGVFFGPTHVAELLWIVPYVALAIILLARSRSAEIIAAIALTVTAIVAFLLLLT